MRRIEPYFPLSRGVSRVDDRRVIRNGLRWRDAPSDYGPHKTIVETPSRLQWEAPQSHTDKWRGYLDCIGLSFAGQEARLERSRQTCLQAVLQSRGAI